MNRAWYFLDVNARVSICSHELTPSVAIRQFVLREPGERYDKTSGLLYFYHREDMRQDSSIGKVNDRALYLGGLGPNRSKVLPAREKYFGKSKAYLISLFRWNLTAVRRATFGFDS
jgi:hypothetical protein